MYEYAAYLLRVVDGDTVDCFLDQGADEFRRIRLRLAAINAPEMKTPDGKPNPAGEQSQLWAGRWFEQHAPNSTIVIPPTHVVINTTKDRKDPYGRYLAKITAPDGHVFNDDILADGMAVVYR